MSIPKLTLQELSTFYAYHYTPAGDPIVRCVVDDTINPDWHHLDDNHANNDIGNIIPLAPRLNQYLGGIKAKGAPKDEDLFHECLRPSVLCLRAELYATQWRFAQAIGCLRLASYLCRPPYHMKDNDYCLAITCQSIRHLRHHTNYTILSTTLRDVRRILSKMSSVRIETLIKLEYDLIALLNEHGEFRRASVCAQNMHWRKDLEQRLPRSKKGSIKRRIYQVALLDSYHFPLSHMLKELQEMSEDSLALETSLANTHVLEALAEQDHKKIQQSYDHVSLLCSQFSPEIKKKRKPGVGPSDLAEIFLYRAILAMLLKPANYESIVEKSCDRSSILFSDCHALLTYQYPEFWPNVLQRLSIDPESNHPLTRAIIERDRGCLPEEISLHIDEIFKFVEDVIVII